MSDQAAKLRALVGASHAGAEAAERVLPLVVVTGARAGVGATTVSLNLAAVMADRGQRVLLIDGGPQRSEPSDTNRVRPDVKHTLADVLGGKCDIGEAIVPGPTGVAMVLSRGRVSPKRDGEHRKHTLHTLHEHSRREQERFVSQLDSVCDDFDLVIIDAGRGGTPWSRRCWSLAKLNVLVTTAEDAAVLAAYTVLKETATEAPEHLARLIVNQAESDASAHDTEQRIMRSCQRFLSRSIQALPALPRHVAADLASAGMAPRVWDAPNSPFGHAALWLGRAMEELLRNEDVDCGEHVQTDSSFSASFTSHPVSC
jgi:flagellar biosynthesis protein FlhG